MAIELNVIVATAGYQYNDTTIICTIKMYRYVYIIIHFQQKMSERLTKYHEKQVNRTAREAEAKAANAQAKAEANAEAAAKAEAGNMEYYNTLQGKIDIDRFPYAFGRGGKRRTKRFKRCKKKLCQRRKRTRRKTMKRRR